MIQGGELQKVKTVFIVRIHNNQFLHSILPNEVENHPLSVILQD